MKDLFDKPNILVCTDFSRSAKLALEAAETIRSLSDGHIHLLHVLDYPSGTTYPDNFMFDNLYSESFYNTLSDSMNQLLKVCKKNAEASYVSGYPQAMVTRMLKEKNIDLLVLGRKSNEGSPFRIGGLTQKLIASSPVPLLVANSTFRTDRIASLIDPNGEMKETLRIAVSAARFFKSKLEIISLFEDVYARFIHHGKMILPLRIAGLTPEQRDELVLEIRGRIQRAIPSEASVEIRVETTHENKLAYQLVRILGEDHVDLAIMRKHQTSVLENLFIGSETRRVLELYEKNLLILPVE